MDRDLTAALAFVNRVREETGHEPLTEMPRAQGCACPVMVAVPDCISAGQHAIKQRWGLGQLWIEPTEAVRGFMAKFDAGRYPELAARPDEGCPRERHSVTCPSSAYAALVA